MLRLADDLSLPLDAVTQTFGVLAVREQRAWFAGLFEGEGCIHHDQQRRGKRRALTIVNTDRDVVERALTVAGCGRLGTKKVYGKRKPIFVWRVQRWRDVHAVAVWLLPYLCERRRTKLLSLLRDPPSKCLGHCPRCGTRYAGSSADVYRRQDGRLQCAPCTRARMRARRAAA